MEKNNEIEEVCDNVFVSFMSLEEMTCQKIQFQWCWQISLWSPNTQQRFKLPPVHFKNLQESL